MTAESETRMACQNPDSSAVATTIKQIKQRRYRQQP